MTKKIFNALTLLLTRILLNKAMMN